MSDQDEKGLSEPTGPRSAQDEMLHDLFDPHHLQSAEEVEAKIRHEGGMVLERRREQDAFDSQRKGDQDLALHYTGAGLPLPADLQQRLAERRPPDIELKEEDVIPEIPVAEGKTEPLFDKRSKAWRGLREFEEGYTPAEQKIFRQWFQSRKDVQEYVYGGATPQERTDRYLETAIKFAGVTLRNEYKRTEHELQQRTRGETVAPTYEQIEVDPRHLDGGQDE